MNTIRALLGKPGLLWVAVGVMATMIGRAEIVIDTVGFSGDFQPYPQRGLLGLGSGQLDGSGRVVFSAYWRNEGFEEQGERYLWTQGTRTPAVEWRADAPQIPDTAYTRVGPSGQRASSYALAENGRAIWTSSVGARAAGGNVDYGIWVGAPLEGGLIASPVWDPFRPGSGPLPRLPAGVIGIPSWTTASPLGLSRSGRHYVTGVIESLEGFPNGMLKRHLVASSIWAGDGGGLWPLLDLLELQPGFPAPRFVGWNLLSSGSFRMGPGTGNLYWLTTIQKATDPTQTRQVLYTIRDQAADPIYATGDPLPGLGTLPDGEPPATSVYRMDMSIVDVDDLGQALLMVTASHRNVIDVRPLGMWFASWAGLKPVVRYGVDMETEGGSLRFISPVSGTARAAAAAGGSVAMLATYTGLGSSTPNMGLFKQSGAGWRLVAPGQAVVPGTNLTLQHDATLGPVLMNAEGTTAFAARYREPNNAQSPAAIWIEAANGLPRRALFVGQEIEVAGERRRVTRFTLIGSGPTPEAGLINRLGMVLANVVFADGTWAILRLSDPDRVADNLIGGLAGSLHSAQPTVTDDERAVHRARLSIFEQMAGRLRERRPNETESDYDEFLASSPRRLVAALTVTAGDRGRFDTGRVLPMLKSNPEAAALTENHYMIEVSDAETDEFVLEGGQVNRDLTETLPFATKRVPNVTIPNPGPDPWVRHVEVVLDPLVALGAKQRIVRTLRRLSPNNYLPVEDEVEFYLGRIESGAVPYTAVVDEGLLRALWAERVIQGGAQLADHELRLSMTALKNLLNDVMSEVLGKLTKSQSLKEAEERLEALEKANPDETVFQINKRLTEGATARLSSDETLVLLSEVVGILNGIVDYFKPVIQFALVKAGLTAAKASQLADLWATATKSILAALQDDGLGAFGRGARGLGFLVDTLTGLLTDALKDQLFDAVGVPSYCDQTRPALEFSSQRMRSWAVSDRPAYLVDRDRVTTLMSAMNEESTAAIAVGEAGLELAEGFGKAADAFGVLATVAKVAKGFEQTTKFGKYLSNIIVFVAPLAEALGRVPGYVEEGVYAAYGQTPPPDGRRAVAAGRGLRSGGRNTRSGGACAAASASPEALLAQLAAVESDLLASRLAEAGEAMFGEAATGVFHLRQAWRRDTRRCQAAACARMGTDAEVGNRLAPYLQELRDADWEELAAAALCGESLRDLLFRAGTDVYDSTTDPAYLADRLEAVSHVRRLARAIESTGRGLVSLEETLAAAPEPDPSLVTPLLVIEPVSVLSAPGGSTVVSSLPATFEVKATVFNPGSLEAPPTAVELEIVGPATGAAIVGSAVRITPVLAPCSSADLTWTITFDAAYQAPALGFLVRAATAPATPFPVWGTSQFLRTAPGLVDADADGMHDSQEPSLGLNPALNDGSGDLDGDGLTNADEYEDGTSPNLADTDADGLSDAEEIELQADGVLTNPLVADTDGDGIADGADGSPLDASTSAPTPRPPTPRLRVEPSRVVLSNAQRQTLVQVGNAGGGRLQWIAAAELPRLVQLAGSADTPQPPGSLPISAASDFPLPVGRTLETTVRVIDASNPGESAVVTVVLSADGSDPGAPAPPARLDVRRALDGSLVISVTGPAAVVQTLQLSSNLVHWSDGPAVQTQGETVPVEVTLPWDEEMPGLFIRARRSP